MKIATLGRNVIGGCLAVALSVGCAGPASSPQLRVASDWYATEPCKPDHGVVVQPCIVELTPDYPKTRVVAKGPKGGTFSFSDRQCVYGDIAQIEGKSSPYLVIAGDEVGTCTATFDDRKASGKLIGKAAVSITFEKRVHCPPTCLTERRRSYRAGR
jgi:hypothetical protein